MRKVSYYYRLFETLGGRQYSQFSRRDVMKNKSEDSKRERVVALHKGMSVEEFDNGYWYATDLKAFADTIGVQKTDKLRKDELEKILRAYFESGKVDKATPKRLKSAQSNVRDSDKKLTRNTLVVNYINDQKTKDFVFGQADKICPKSKSGERYWINRWREQQLEAGKAITYGELIDHLVELRKQPGRLPQIPSTKYNNFVSDYLSANEGSTKAEAIAEWDRLKAVDVPKTFAGYQSFFKKVKASSGDESLVNVAEDDVKLTQQFN